MAIDLGREIPAHLVVTRRAQESIASALAPGSGQRIDLVAGALLAALADLEQELVAVRHEFGDTRTGPIPRVRRRPVDDDLL